MVSETGPNATTAPQGETVSEPAPLLPPRPRPITSLVARRAWGDIHVRFWWLSALAVTGIIAYFTIGQVREALRDREVILHGMSVQATILKAGERDIRGHAVLRDTAHSVVLEAKMPEGNYREFRGTVGPGPGYLKVGETLDIRVDRNNPDVWTDRQEVTPWSRQLTITFIFLPVIAALLLGAVVARRRLLKVWRNGMPAEGTVVDLRHSAWAPFSRVVRYSLAESRDRRIFSALAPTRFAPAKGQTVHLLAPADGSSKPTLLARLYTS